MSSCHKMNSTLLLCPLPWGKINSVKLHNKTDTRAAARPCSFGRTCSTVPCINHNDSRDKFHITFVLYSSCKLLCSRPSAKTSCNENFPHSEILYRKRPSELRFSLLSSAKPANVAQTCPKQTKENCRDTKSLRLLCKNPACFRLCVGSARIQAGLFCRQGLP